jgi:hypothetical protein
MVRMPDTTGTPGQQIKNAKDVPVRVLRGFFAGIGQLLLAADRLRAEEEQREGIEQDDHDGPPTGLDGEHAPHPMTTVDYVRTTTPRPRPRQAGAWKKRKAASPRKFRSLDATGNVRLLTPDMPAESSSGDDRPAPRARQRRPARPAASRAAKPPPARGAAPAAGLPVPGYDGLSLASLRARLRNLDATQVRTLLEHEKSAANRADVVAMLERRVARLEARRDAP